MWKSTQFCTIFFSLLDIYIIFPYKFDLLILKQKNKI